MYVGMRVEAGYSLQMTSLSAQPRKDAPEVTPEYVDTVSLQGAGSYDPDPVALAYALMQRAFD